VGKARVPATSGWSIHGFTAPALPAGSTAASAGVQLVGNGTLDLDDVVVVPEPA
jgi:hypothetical protein